MENTEQIALAPAAGAGIGKQLFDRLLAMPDFLDLLTEAARCGLTAMTPRRWDKESGTWQSDPDARIRTQTLFGLIAQAEGEPVKRILHSHFNAAGGVDVLAALRESPALAEAAQLAIDKAKWRTSGNQASKRPKKAAPVVEGEASPAREEV